jgi:uncharacterized protein Yka (UPF0111/DUF47 family)
MTMFNLLPRDPKFFEQLELLAKHVAASTQELAAITQRFPSLDGHLEGIERTRQAARDLTQEALTRLDQAFITPLDREDILALLSDLYKPCPAFTGC